MLYLIRHVFKKYWLLIKKLFHVKFLAQKWLSIMVMIILYLLMEQVKEIIFHLSILARLSKL